MGTARPRTRHLQFSFLFRFLQPLPNPSCEPLLFSPRDPNYALPCASGVTDGPHTPASRFGRTVERRRASRPGHFHCTFQHDSVQERMDSITIRPAR